MSDCNRGKRPTPVDWLFPIIGIVGAVTLSWGLGHLEGAEAERRHNIPKAYEQSAEVDTQRACAGRQPSAMFECVNARVKAAREAAHDEQDLSAQQRAATSALAAALVALLTLIVSGVGVWFVKRTLDATLEAVEDTSKATEAMYEANRIARESSNADLRPWIKIDLSVTKFEMTEHKIQISIIGTFTNVGKTVASDVAAEIKCAYTTYKASFDYVDAYLQEVDFPKLRTFSMIPGASGESAVDNWQAVQHVAWEGEDPVCVFVVMVSVRYRGLVDGEDHWTQQSFTVGKRCDDLMRQRFLFKDMMGFDADQVVLKNLRSGRVC